MTETQKQDSDLPPGWEAVESDSKKVYYWNRKTGETTWSFPEAAVKQHVEMVRRHTYENVRKNPTLNSKSSPCLLLQQPPRSRRATHQGVRGGERSTGSLRQSGGAVQQAQISASNKKGYENVVFQETKRTGSPSLRPGPHSVRTGSPSAGQYEEIDEPGQDPHTRARMSSLTSSNLSEPLSPSPPLPDRKYSDTDLTFSPGPVLPDRRYTPPPEAVLEEGRGSPGGVADRKTSISSVHQTPAHQVSDMGDEYAIISHKKQSKEGGGAPGNVPPSLPLRAHQRMAADTAKEGGVPVVVATPPQYADVGVETGHPSVPAPQEGYHAPIAYSTVKLDPETGKVEQQQEGVTEPCPLSPRPYEVASPTPGSTPHHELNTGPHYEEIEGKDDVSGDGYMKVDHNRRTRPRGFSTPSPLGAREQSPSPEDSSLSPAFNSIPPTYDLPSNSRKLQALNVTLRRSATPQTDYAKLSLSKEAILLRSGVTLRRHVRESLSSLSSYASQMDGEEGGEEGKRKESEGGSSGEDDDALEPINKCIKSLETSLINSDSPEAADYFNNMVVPQPTSPSWVNFRRRPHAYEEIMGASQEELDWDESDLPAAPPTSTTKEGEEEPCVMVKVEQSPSKVREQRVRVVHHQYEDVKLEAEPVVQAGDQGSLKESWVDEEKEDTGLPRGWQRMRDEQQKEYYWHIPTGRTQYSPPTNSPSKKQSVSEGPPGDHTHCFPAQYLGWLPVSEDRLVTGQCVKVVHTCITKMAASVKSKEKQGEEVLLQVEGMEFRQLKPGTLSVLGVQPINRIRVWGIGLEDERDFGYVSRDPVTKKHRCHIFRCAMPARAVAHVLLETHQQQRQARLRARIGKHSSQTSEQVTSPTRSDAPAPPPPVSNGAGPHGSHERYERFMCVFVGSCVVGQGQGMDALNGAVEHLALQTAQWRDVCVDVAISSITIADAKSGRVFKEHRVRYLSFLGIATDDKFCGYILDCGERNGEKCFRFYGFRMEPNTDRLCLSLHSACQARYQRVLEANAKKQVGNTQAAVSQEGQGANDTTPSKSLLGKFGSLKKSKRLSIGEVKTFVVQYLGQQGVDRVDGLETVRPVVQELAVNPLPNCPRLVEFDICPSGLTIREGQGKISRKEFPVKCITYVVKIRNYFAFVAKERSKYICHTFMEYKVDAGTIVSAIQDTLVPQSAK